nr:helix-turn-helix domain-containing protein [Ktedonobacter sp. SOSP1-52]
MSPAQREEAKGLLEAAVSQRAVAKQLGVSYETLRRSFKRSER